MSHCKIEHSLLVFYNQKNLSTTSKTVYKNVFLFFCFSELIVVKFYLVYELGNYNRNSIWVRPTVSILASCVRQIETYVYNVTFLKNDGADYALGVVIEIY